MWRDPYKRFLENKLREHFDFTGVPVSVVYEKEIRSSFLNSVISKGGS